MAIDWTYYNTITKSTPLQNKQEIIAEMQENMSTMLEENHISEFEVKIGMDYYKQIGLVNFTKQLEYFVKFDRLKEKIYNLNSRSLFFKKGGVETGDYITIKEAHDDENGIEQTYIARSRVEYKRTYDDIFILHCQWETKLLDAEGNIVRIPLCYSDNTDRLASKESANTDYIATTVQAYVQNNPTTGLRLTKGQRILIWDDLAVKWLAYEVKDAQSVSMKGLTSVQFGVSQIISDDDNLDLGIANYRTQMEKIGNIEPPLYDIILGEDEVYIDSPYLENPYNLTSVIEPYSNSWSIETPMDGVTLVPYDKNKCYLGIANKPILVNKIIVLKATLNGVVYTKEIKIRGY